MKATRFIRISLVLIVLYAVTALLVIHFEMEENPDMKKRVGELSETHSVAEEMQEASAYDAFAQALLDSNPQSAGWITIPGTTVDYPVVLAEDNEIYLKLDYLGNANSLGTLFFDYECRVEDRDCRNLIIYGHTASSGLMFGGLRHYRDKNFFEENSRITLYRIGEGERTFQVFSVFVSPAYPGAETDHMDYRQIYFEDEEYSQWLSYFKGQSLHQSDVEFSPDRQVLTLSTCAYDFQDARLVVMAVEID